MANAPLGFTCLDGFDLLVSMSTSYSNRVHLTNLEHKTFTNYYTGILGQSDARATAGN